MTPRPITLPSDWRLHQYDVLDSTNAEAERRASRGAGHGTVVWARRQTAGRGRQGRTWESPAGNLYFSAILRPDVPPGEAAQIGFAAALAVVDALVALTTGIDYTLKWPNDVLFNGRKGCGILLESVAGPRDAVRSLVVGFGVNLSQAPSNARFPATSVRDEGFIGEMDEGVVLGTICDRFAGQLRRWEDEGFTAIREAWLARAAALGDAIEARLPSGTLNGNFEDLDADGCLLLRLGDGQLRRISAGEVYLGH